MARHETGWFARASREQARGRIAISLGNVRLAAGVNPQAPGNEEKTRSYPDRQRNKGRVHRTSHSPAPI